MKRPWSLMENNITREDLNTVISFLEGNPILTQSKQVEAFEEAWSSWLGVKYSVFVNSGSSANLITLGALRESYGVGEVIVPTLTWVSDIAAVLQNGFTPVFVDINPLTLGMDTQQALQKVTQSTKAIFPTHVLGYNAFDEKFLRECELLSQRGVHLLEDVCESHGATFTGKRLGSFGLMSNFSFYYAHHMSTIEGGMVCTDDKKLYEILRMFRSHGMVRENNSPESRKRYHELYPDLNPDFIFAFPAYNVRSTEINAVLGISQLKRLDEKNQKRKDNLAIFLNNLDCNRYQTDFAAEGNCNYAFTLVLREPDDELRDRVMKTLRAHQIEHRRGTSGGGNQLRQPYMRKIFPDIDYKREFPHVDHVHFYGFYIGNYPSLEKEDVLGLCNLLNTL